MTQENATEEVKQWLSTYGMMTAERILEKYQFNPGLKRLMPALKNPQSVYYQMMMIPVNNVLSGIVCEQAKSYQLYCQKIYIDYYVSGENSKPKDASGGQMRMHIEQLQEEFSSISDRFQRKENEYLEFIASSQADLIAFGKRLNSALQALIQTASQCIGEDATQAIKMTLAQVRGQQAFDEAYINEAVTLVESYSVANLDAPASEKLKEGFERFFKRFQENESFEHNLSRSKQYKPEFKQFQVQFYEHISLISPVIDNLSDYYIDEKSKEENESTLSFDKDLFE